MSRPNGAIQRAARTIVVETVKGVRARDTREAQLKFEEVELEYQMRVSGAASSVVGTPTDIDIAFDHDLFYAPAQRDSELTRPHFTYGGEVLEGSGVAFFMAVVKEWKINGANGAITGATVSVSVVAPSPTNFNGYVHMTFHGWGALREADGDLG